MKKGTYYLLVIIVYIAYAYPTNAFIFDRDVKKAKDFMKAGMYPQAIAVLEKRINDKPTDAEAHFQLGICYINISDYEAADKRFASAVSLKSDYGYKIGNEFLKKGVSQLNQKQFNIAKVSFSNALKYQPTIRKDIAKEFFKIGSEYIKQGEKSIADDLLFMAVKYDHSLSKTVERLNFDYKQAIMKNTFERAQLFEKNRNALLKDKIDEWLKFQEYFKDDNPYSKADDEMRIKAYKQINYLQKKVSSLTEDLLLPNKRNEALFELLSQQQYATIGEYKEKVPESRESCKVNHVVVCPQKEGDPIYAVFKSSNRDIAPTGKPEKHLILFDRKGQMIHFYDGANYIKGDFYDINNDDIIENVESIGCSLGQNKPIIYTLTVLPITIKQQPIFQVIYNWSTASLPWDWRLIDLNQDGVKEIQIGHDFNDGEEGKEFVIYRWDKKYGRYTGPSGSPDKHFMVIENYKSKWDYINKFGKNKH